MISIRRTADVAAVRDLDRRILPLDAAVVTDASSWWWLACDDGEPIGYAGIAVHSHTPDVAYFRRAGLLESHRGRGLGQRLIDVRIRWAIRQRFASVQTYTATHNFASMRALARAGFLPHEPGWCRRVGTQWMYWRRDLEAR